MLKPLTSIVRHPLFLCAVSFICCFCLGLLLFLPLDLFTQPIEQLARQQGLELRIRQPSLIFPPGLGVEELTVSHPQIPHPPLLLTEMSLYPLWSTVAGGNPGMNFRFKTLQGQIDGTAFRSGKVTTSFSGLKINESLGPQLPLTVSGSLDSGTFEGTLPLQGQNHSQLQFAMNDLQLAGMQKFGSADDILEIGQLRCNAEATGPLIKITSLETNGPSLTLTGNGTLRLGPTPERSSLNLNLTLIPQGNLDPLLKDLLGLLQKPTVDGSYRLRLVGTLVAVRLL